MLGEGGPITLGEGDGEFASTRTDRSGRARRESGRLKIVSFANPGALVQEHSSRLRADGQTAMPVDRADGPGGLARAVERLGQPIGWPS